jgi:hypothetical protein
MDDAEVVELFFDFLKILPISTLKTISNGSDVLNELTYDSEEDLKNEVWNRIKYGVNFSSLIRMLDDYLKNNEDEDET